MTKVRLLVFQTKKNDWLSNATTEYVKKISGFIEFEVSPLKTLKAPRENAVEKKRQESESILAALDPGAPFFLFDERGKTYDSKQFSRFMGQQLESGIRRVSFVLGGAFGFSDELKSRARGTISLSTLTFSHHVAQIVVLEQIYRALAIRKGIPYHND